MRHRYEVEQSEGRSLSYPARFALAGLAVFLCALIGCSSLPDIHYYDIRLPDPPSAGPGGFPDAVPLPILVVGVDLPAHLDFPEIFYRKSLYQAGYYEYHRWVRPLSESLEGELVRYLEKTGCFAVIDDPQGHGDASAAHPEASVRLYVEVIEFNENDGEGDLWTVDAEFLVRLENLPGGRSRSATITRNLPVFRRNAAGTVEALNRAFTEIVGELVAEIGGGNTEIGGEGG